MGRGPGEHVLAADNACTARITGGLALLAQRGDHDVDLRREIQLQPLLADHAVQAVGLFTHHLHHGRIPVAGLRGGKLPEIFRRGSLAAGQRLQCKAVQTLRVAIRTPQESSRLFGVQKIEGQRVRYARLGAPAAPAAPCAGTDQQGRAPCSKCRFAKHTTYYFYNDSFRPAAPTRNDPTSGRRSRRRRMAKPYRESIKKRVSYLYRTATTAYPCSLPRLGDSAGAGRIRLTLAQR